MGREGLLAIGEDGGGGAGSGRGCDEGREWGEAGGRCRYGWRRGAGEWGMKGGRLGKSALTGGQARKEGKGGKGCLCVWRGGGVRMGDNSGWGGGERGVEGD